MTAFSIQFNSKDELNQVVNTLIGLGYTQVKQNVSKYHKVVDVHTLEKQFVLATTPYMLLIAPEDIEETLLLIAMKTDHETLMDTFGIRGK